MDSFILNDLSKIPNIFPVILIITISQILIISIHFRFPHIYRYIEPFLFGKLKRFPRIYYYISKAYQALAAILMITLVILVFNEYGIGPGMPFLWFGILVLCFIPVVRQWNIYYKILICSVVLIIGQLVTLFVSPDWKNQNYFYQSYFSLSSVFLTLNGILTCLNVWLAYGKQWNLNDNLQIIRPQFIRFCPSWDQENPPILLGGGIYSYFCKITWRTALIRLNLFVSWLIILIYGSLGYYTTSLTTLTIFTAISVIITDIMIFITMNFNDDKFVNPNFISFLIMLARFCLFGFSSDYWFLGYCFLYIFFTLYCATLIINRHYPHFQKIPNLQVHKTNLFKIPEFAVGIATIFFSVLIYYISILDYTNIPVLSIQIGMTNYPFWAIGIGSILLTLAFSLYLCSLRIVERRRNNIKEYQIYYIGTSRCSDYWIFGLSSYICIVLFGLYFYLVVNNVIIFITTIFIPMIYQAFLQFYRNWQYNQYMILGDVDKFNKKSKKGKQKEQKLNSKKQQIMNKLKVDIKGMFNRTFTKFFTPDKQKQTFEFQKRNTMRFNNDIIESIQIKEIKQNKKQEDEEYSNLEFFEEILMNKSIIIVEEKQNWRLQHSFCSALFEGLLLPTDNIILVSLPVMIILLVCFSLTCYFADGHNTIAFTISIFFLCWFLTCLPMKRYLSTLDNPNCIEIGMFIFGILLNFGYGVTGITMGQVEERRWLTWWAFINPLIISIYATFVFAFDYGVCLKSVFSAAISLMIGFGMGIFVLGALSDFIGILIIIAFFYYFWILMAYFYFLKNQEWPNNFFIIVASVIILTAIGITIALYIITNLNWFILFTILYFLIFLVLGIYISYVFINDLFNNQEIPNFYSPTGEAYQYQSSLQSAVKNNFYFRLLFIFLISIFIYSILVMLFVKPIQIGVSIMSLWFALSFLYFMYFQSFNPYRGGKIKNKITPNMIKEAWKEELEIQKKIKIEYGSLQNSYKAALERYELQYEKEEDDAQKLKLEEYKLDLTAKIEKEKEEQDLIGVNLWLRIITKVQASEKSKWIKYINFINSQFDVLMTMGIFISVDNLLSNEQKYSQIKRDYTLLTEQQKIKFDYFFKIYEKQKETENKLLEEKLKQEEQIKQRRQKSLLEKLIQENNSYIDDSKQPIEKMRDSLKKLEKIRNLNVLYTDTSFPCDKYILPQYALQSCKGFKRPLSNTTLIQSQQSRMNVKQGQLGDCYLISSIGVLTKKYMNQMLGIGKWVNPKGCYMVKFRKMNKDIYIIVDDQFPVDSNGNWLFGRCENLQQIYVNVIEKAYAKLHGGYGNIIGGKINLTLAEFTGGFPEEISLKKYQESISNATELHQKMLKYYQLGYLLGAGSTENVKGDSVSVEGIIQSHAYQILNVKNLSGNRLLQLRNPHGSGGKQWQGDWSNNSQKWTQRLLKLLNQDLEKENGAFWMCIQDFVYLYKSLYVCRIFDEKIWAKKICKGEWRQEKAAGLPSKQYPAAKMYKNPHYGITVYKKSTLFVQLQQNQMSGNWRGKNFIFFMVQKNHNGKRIENVNIEKLCGRSQAPADTYQVSGEVTLDAPIYPYTFSLMVACINPGDEGTFNLVMYCDDHNFNVIEDENFN